VKALEKRQKARTQRIVLKGGVTKAECERASNVAYTDRISGRVVRCSQTTVDQQAKGEVNPRKAVPVETLEERMERLMADAGKPYWQR
jgi:hypothetical protein